MPITVTLPTDPHSLGDTGHTTDHNTIVTAIQTIANYPGIADWQNVKASAYGAVGNGSTDDSTAIQAALNAVHTAGGGVVYLPASTYSHATTLTVYNNTVLIGDGPQASILSYTGTGTAAVITDTSATGCVFRDFGINVNQSSGSASHGLDLVATTGKPVSLHRVFNVNVYYAGKDGFHLGASIIEAVLDNCFAYGCQRAGFYTEVSATDNKIVNSSSAQSASHGFYILGNTLHLTSCKSYYSGFVNGTAGNTTSDWNDASGFYLGPAATQSLSRVWLDSCEAQNNGTNGFFLDGSASTAQCDHISLVNCSSDGDNCKADGGVGLKIYRAIDCVISNFNTHIGSGPVSGSTINYGLAIFSALAGTAINNCHFEGTDGTIYIDSGAANYTFNGYNVYPSNDTTGATDKLAINVFLAAGYPVHLAPGNYYTNGDLAFANNSAIYGAGQGSTFLYFATGYSGTGLCNISGAVFCTIADLTISGISTTYSTNPAGNGIYVAHSNNATIKDVVVQYVNGWGIQIISDATSDSYKATIHNSKTYTCKNGCQINGTASSDHNMAAFLSDVDFENTQVGDSLQIIDAHDVTVTNLEGTTVSGGGSTLSILGLSAAVFVYNIDLGPTSQTQAVVYMDASGGNSPRQIVIDGGVIEGGTPGVVIQGATADIVLANLMLLSNQGDGIDLAGTATRIDVHDCHFITNGQTAGTHYDVKTSASGIVTLHDNTFQTPLGSSSGEVTAAVSPTAGTVLVDRNKFVGATAFVTNFPTRAKDNYGYNPVGHVTSPSLPGTTVALTNPFGSDAFVVVTAGAATTTVAIGGVTALALLTTTSSTFFVPYGQTITLTYTSGTPVWTWFVS
jgi:hypothetical protein